MFRKVLILFALVLCAVAQEEPHPAPEPYSFTYEAPNEDGSSSAREETGDASGRITGFYIIKGADGQDRRVDYFADETGFHAEVSTNELGTESHEAASAIYRSSAPSVSELIAQWEASGASAAQAAGAARRQSAAASIASGGLSSSSTSSFSTASRVAQIKPAVSAVQTVRTSEVVSSAPVTPEGYVLVRASAAKSVGLQGVEVDNLQGLSSIIPTIGRGASGSSSTTTTTRVSGSRVLNIQTQGGGGLTGGASFQPSASTLSQRFALLRQQK